MGQDVMARRRELKITGGGTLSIRRVGRSRLNDCGVAAGWTEGNTATEEKRVEYVVRAAIVGAEGLTDAGEAVPFATTLHPVLGRIAAASVYDALSTEDAIAAFGAAMENGPSGEAAPAGGQSS